MKWVHLIYRCFNILKNNYLDFFKKSNHVFISFSDYFKAYQINGIISLKFLYNLILN